MFWNFYLLNALIYIIVSVKVLGKLILAHEVIDIYTYQQSNDMMKALFLIIFYDPIKCLGQISWISLVIVFFNISC